MSNFALQQYREILRRDFYAFTHRAFLELNPQTKLIPNWHIEVLAAKLDAVRRGEIRRVIINVPPRSLKSHCASVAFPAWLLGHNPSVQILTISYGQDLADKLARDCRSLMASEFYRSLFATRLSLHKHAVAEFETTKKGGRFSTSIGGVLTGRGADYIIIDDPLKPDDAFSESRRNAVNEWFGNTLYTRLNDKARGAIILVMQRLHQDDLVAFVLAQENWELVSFAAIAEEDQHFSIDTPYGPRHFHRTVGDVLHPVQESRDTLERIRQAIGQGNFSAQYQQRPAPLEGGLIQAKWFRRYDQLSSSFEEIIQSWDTANKATELSDFSVCTTWGKLDKHLYLLDVLRKRLNFPELKRTIREHARACRATVILIEDQGSGTQLIQDLIAEGVRGVTGYTTKGDKTMRFAAQTTLIESGLVLLPRNAPWLDDYIGELVTFPKGKYDDQVDSTSQALDWTREQSSTSGAAWIEDMKRRAREAIEPKMVRMNSNGHTGQYLLNGTLYYADENRTLEVPEETATALRRLGWRKVD